MSFRKIFIRSLGVMLIASSLSVPTMAADAVKTSTQATQEKRVLTLQEAVKSAINSSTNLKLLEKTTSTNRYLLEHSRLDDYSDRDLSYTIEENEQNSAFYKDKLEYLTGSYYDQIIIANANLELYDKQIASLEKDIEVLKLKLSHGYTDELSLKSEQSKLEQLKNTKMITEANLDKLKEDFRIVTNLDSTKYTLENNIAYEPFRATTSINGYINTRIDEMQKFSVEYANYFSSSLGARISLPNSNEISESKYANTALQEKKLYGDIAIKRDNYMQTLLGQYTQIIDTEKNIDNTKEQIAMLDKNIAAAKVKLDKGLATSIEYDKLLLQKEELENTLLNSIYKHQDLKNVLNKPWVSLM